MKTRLTIIMLGAVLLFAGIAGAQQALPLPAASIPQFVEPLPLLEFEFINATSGALPGVLAALPALNGAPFPVNAEEFQAQILPSATCSCPWRMAACNLRARYGEFGLGIHVYSRDSRRYSSDVPRACGYRGEGSRGQPDVWQ